ncbi:translation initiation factor IF-2 [Verruconis gallopava]|uniref:Translation initiation factor IF-2, mitochondrial n=1 Tax=Verruconis gallopava TaxID=253628 RepID=A0A0D2A146_9PEZI|nr:translation initiation factor IF-2 [Verruconis gallopava]KIW00393.1 translation initiation factor IF-2 [Verruconis gallopava]
MRQSRALRVATQDVCIFCAYRPTPPSSSLAGRARVFSNQARPQHQQAAALSLKDDDADGGWGGLADETESISSPVAKTQTKAQEPPTQSSDFPRQIRRVLQRDNYQAKREPANGARIRLVASVGETKPANSSKWAILRGRQQGQLSRDRPEIDQTSKYSGSRPDSAHVPWSRSTGSSNAASYVPFDSRFDPSKLRMPRAFEEDSTRSASQNRTSSNQRQLSEQVQERIGRRREPESRVTEDAVIGRPRPAAREELDEYGFPIANSASAAEQVSTSLEQRASPSTATREEARQRHLESARAVRRGDRSQDHDLKKDSRKKGRIGRTSVRDEDHEDDFDVDEYHRRKRERQAARALEKSTSKMKEERRTIRLPDFIRVGNLATELQLRYHKFAAILEKFGFEDVNSDYVLSAENAALIVEEAGFNAVTESTEPDQDLYAAPLPEDTSSLPPRPPVVTIMGHVDHGKTTILDFLRNSSIAASEHGGITQHIGAFSVPMPSGKTITFLDTPGHAAFLSMRQRGANVTDIVVLVVAADDSVKPQTLEALKHARAANVPIIVAMTKIDKPEAKPEQVKQDLARHGVEIEDYGGDVQVVQVSGKTGQGMTDLEEAIIALSEIQDQRAPIDGPVEGWVLESSTKEVGKVATVLIRRGTLRPGDIVVAGTEYCRVRTMRDEFGNQVAQVGPGMPAEIDGWRGQPNAGDEVLQAANEQIAQDVTELREAKLKRLGLTKDVEAINEMRKAQQRRHEREKAIHRAQNQGIVLPDQDASESGDADGVKKVYFIVKADVAGSVEAVVNAITSLGNSEVQPIVLKAAVGVVAESDIDYATAVGGHVVSFNTSIPPSMRSLAERAGTKILDHNIIYRLADDVKSCLEDVLEPVVKSRVLGEAEIAQIFDIHVKRKVVKIAGCKVRNGTILRNGKIRVLRGPENEVVYTGALSSLKHVKKDVMEMAKGSECGMGFEEWQDFQPGDIAQCYEEWEERRKL